MSTTIFDLDDFEVTRYCSGPYQLSYQFRTYFDYVALDWEDMCRLTQVLLNEIAARVIKGTGDDFPMPNVSDILHIWLEQNGAPRK